MSDNLITIATFSQPIEAHILKTKLESEDIDCFIADENTVTMNWLYSNAIGGVKLQVKESDYKKAIAIIQKKNTNILPQNDLNKNSNDPHCPKCNSTNITYEKFSRRFAFISWIISGVALPFIKRKWKCNECGYEWKAKK
jgi:DNA-directed RNA polymerase subunit M/transcription elongation factor TFIIS